MGTIRGRLNTRFRSFPRSIIFPTLVWGNVDLRRIRVHVRDLKYVIVVVVRLFPVFDGEFRVAIVLQFTTFLLRNVVWASDRVRALTIAYYRVIFDRPVSNMNRNVHVFKDVRRLAIEVSRPVCPAVFLICGYVGRMTLQFVHGLRVDLVLGHAMYNEGAPRGPNVRGPSSQDVRCQDAVPRCDSVGATIKDRYVVRPGQRRTISSVHSGLYARTYLRVYLP